MNQHARASRFAFAVLAIYVAAIAPALIRHGFDPSVFIVAGDRSVNPTELASPIYVRPNSNGYDGQFYYRLALAPFDLRQPLYGVHLDAPAYRMQRIVYPLLAWAFSLGRPALTPLALLVLNLTGLAFVAGFAVRLTQQLGLSPMVPVAIVLWPGFLVTLTHDTTEILSTAFLLAALDSYFAGRLIALAIIGALATLTRETSAVVFGGLLVYEMLCRNLKATIACAATIVPFAVWRQLQPVLWGASPSSVVADNVGWPLFGITQALVSMIFGGYVAQAGLKGAILRVYDFASAASLVAFSVLVATRAASARGALAAAWLPTVALMSLLTANGPLIEPISFFRAFTECWIVGCLLIDSKVTSSWIAKPALAGLVVLWIGAGWLSTSAID